MEGRGGDTDNRPANGKNRNADYFRAFIAVEVENRERFATLLQSLSKTGADLKTVSVANLHITLKFLGDTPGNVVPEILCAMRESVASAAPFDIKFQGIGAFPGMSRISVVWVGIHGAEKLGAIAEFLDEQLHRLGFKRENRPFSPHLTLARVRSRKGIDAVRKLIEDNKNIDFGTARVDAIALKKSTLMPQGPVYSTVEEVRFV